MPRRPKTPPWEDLLPLVAPWLSERAGKGKAALPPRPVTTPLPSPRADPDDLQSVVLFNSGPYQGDGQVRTLYWVNQTGRRLLVAACEVWAGMAFGGKADLGAQCFRSPDGSTFALYQWDHYQEPAGPSALRKTFGPHMAVEPNEAVVFSHFATPFSAVRLAHFSCTLWYRYG